MNEIKATFSPEVKDYRTAVFLANALRYHKMIIIFAIVTLAAIICYLLAALGIMPYFMLPVYISMGYLVWFAFICCKLEHGILRYTKSEDCILHKEMSVTFTRSLMKVETPYNNQKSTIAIDKLVYAVELKNLFIIYLDPQHSILLPCRALSPSDRAEVRSLLLNALKGNFSTRYGYTNMLPRRSPLRK